MTALVSWNPAKNWSLRNVSMYVWEVTRGQSMRQGNKNDITSMPRFSPQAHLKTSTHTSKRRPKYGMMSLTIHKRSFVGNRASEKPTRLDYETTVFSAELLSLKGVTSKNVKRASSCTAAYDDFGRLLQMSHSAHRTAPCQSKRQELPLVYHTSCTPAAPVRLSSQTPIPLSNISLLAFELASRA